MKKQVTFAEKKTVHRRHQDEALPRGSGMNESKMDANVNFNNGWKINRSPAARCEAQLQHLTTIQIPKTITAAPFLKHAALTPAQKEYLYTVAASYSTAHVRNLITQHYMNVLHRCIQTGYNPERDDLTGTSVTSPDKTDKSNKHRSHIPAARAKHKEKINTKGRNPGKSFLPKIPNMRARIPNTSAPTQRNMKKRTLSPILRRKSPTRARMRLLEKEEEEEEGLDDSLSECLSSLSLGEWNDDTFSDL
ncbi:protein FAM216A [Dicentrarchus labrax]|uniref:Protein FAM216A n=1 Tax=Dicentrarchus labrax TaxID=13489 RepID=A0A8P4GH47_DICLA|nr:protein FAM216A [Dicentrarchus labrax]